MIQERRTQDEVLREVREIKEKLGAAHGFDVHRILAEARANQEKSRRVVIPVEGRLDRPADATPAGELSNLWRFPFEVNSSFLDYPHHPVTIRKTLYPDLERHVGDRAECKIFVGSREYRGHIYRSVAGYGPYFQLVFDDGPIDGAGLHVGMQTVVELDLSATPISISITPLERGH